MPSGTISYGTFAASTSSDNALASTAITNLLQQGSNVIAVEIHQRSATSSDLSFDLELVAISAGVVDITRGPYLQKGTSSSMVIRWRTLTPTESVVDYGTALGSLTKNVSDLTPKTEHEKAVMCILIRIP